MIKLRDKVKDTITDFRGIAVARCVYLNGCVRIEVQPKKLKDGKMIESVWIDESQLEGVEPDEGETPHGGPGSTPSGFNHPTD